MRSAPLASRNPNACKPLLRSYTTGLRETDILFAAQALRRQDGSTEQRIEGRRVGPRTSPIGALSDRSKETPNGGGSDFHKFMSQSNLVDNSPIQADLFHARYRPFGTTTDGITATQTVSITPRAVLPSRSSRRRKHCRLHHRHFWNCIERYPPGPIRAAATRIG